MTALVRQSFFEQAAHAVIGAMRSPHTRAAYAADLARWIAFARVADFDPASATLMDATSFRDLQLGERSAASAHRTIAALSSVYGKLLRASMQTGQRIVAANPFHPAMLGWPVQPREGKTQAVDDLAARRMIAAAEQAGDLRAVAVLRMLWETGLRRASVAAIRPELLTGGRLLTQIKGGKEAAVVVPPAALAALRALFAAGGKMPTVSGINRIVTLYAQRARAEGVTPHGFRAAFVTAAYDAGVPEYEIQAAVHHADPATTRRYDRGARGGAVAATVAARRDSGEL